MEDLKTQVIRKCANAMAKAALALGKDSVKRSFCPWWFYQPKVPKGMEKYKND